MVKTLLAPAPRRVLVLLAISIAVFATPGVAQGPAADLIMINGHVVTVDERFPEAQALAVRGDRILAVGTNEEIGALAADSTVVIDLAGRLAIPGFIEGHGHLMGIGNALLNLNLMDAVSYDEVVARVAATVSEAEPGQWIVGRGWHQSKWNPPPEPMVRGFQTHHAVSAVSPNNPVYLTHASGHAGMANALAMELAGIDRDTESPPGGEIIKDDEGNPTGVFVETAQGLLRRARAGARESMTDAEIYEESRRALRLAVQEVTSKGVTSFQDAGSGVGTIEMFADALEDRELKMRLWVMLRASVADMPQVLPRIRAIGLGDHRLTIRAIKLGIDGALGPRGAWLLEPYDDDRTSTGHNTSRMENVEQVAALALEHGFQLCVHAIGDRANREVLDVYQRAFAANPEAAVDARFRMEHAQLLAPPDAARFAPLGVIASMQGIHATSDGPWTPDRIGEERSFERAYQFRRLLDSGAVVINGTDAPVEDVDPIASFYASASMRMNNGEVFLPDQRMSRAEALRSYTLSAAYAAFEEDIKGSLTPGKLADIVVLSHDIMTIPEEQIPDARVLYTIVGGEVVYQAEGS